MSKIADGQGTSRSQDVVGKGLTIMFFIVWLCCFLTLSIEAGRHVGKSDWGKGWTWKCAENFAAEAFENRGEQ